MIHTDFPDTNKRALVLVSGGMDSRVCLQKAVHDLGNANVIVACTYYGQKHDKEMQYARKAASQLHVEFYEIDLSPIFSFNTNCSALLKGSSKDIDRSSYEEQMREKVEAGQAPISNAYVPFRNGLFLSYAAALALQFNCQYIVYGAHSDDSNVMIETKDGKVQKCQAYPDCTSEFIEAMSEAIRQGTGGTVELVAPIYNLTKSEVAKLGIKLGMTKEDFKHTWSCYEGGEKECGICGTCRDKIKALKAIDFTKQDLESMFDSISEEPTIPFWDVVAEIDWRKVCQSGQIRPYVRIKEQLNQKYGSQRLTELHFLVHEHAKTLLDKISEFAAEYHREKSSRSNFFEDCGFGYMSDDSFWYLCTFIVGCGRESYEQVLNDPAKIGEFTDFREGFPYCFV